MIKKIKQFIPAVNPLPAVRPVRGYVTRAGKLVQPYRRKPKFRTGITVGYKYN